MNTQKTEEIPATDARLIGSNCREVAEENIARYCNAIKNDPKANPDVCHEMIDKWLDYWQAHSPTDTIEL